jgi:hypothetical protein
MAGRSGTSQVQVMYSSGHHVFLVRDAIDRGGASLQNLHSRDRPVESTTREFAVVEVLAGHARKVLTRRQIASQVRAATSMRRRTSSTLVSVSSAASSAATSSTRRGRIGYCLNA